MKKIKVKYQDGNPYVFTTSLPESTPNYNLNAPWEVIQPNTLPNRNELQPNVYLEKVVIPPTYDNVTPPQEVLKEEEKKKKGYLPYMYQSNYGHTTDEDFYNAGALAGAARGIKQGNIDAAKGYGTLAGIGAGFSALGGVLGGAKSFLSGMAMQNSFADSEQERQRQYRQQMVNDYNMRGEKGQTTDALNRTNVLGRSQDGGNPYLKSYQDGGGTQEIKSVIAGDIAPTPQAANAELEKEEFVIDAETGDVRFVAGQGHEETAEHKGEEYSGTPTNLKPTDFVISNNGKIDRKIAKQFGVEGANTYAEVIKKHPAQKKIDKINLDIAELAKKAEKFVVETDNPIEKTTNSRNLEYISNKINAKNEELAPYKQEILGVAKQVYSLQEEAKNNGTYNGIKPPIEQPLMQEGGNNPLAEVANDVATMLQQGVSPEEILAQLVEAGVGQEQATQLIQQVMQGGQMQDGGGQDQVMQLIQMYAEMSGQDPEQIMAQLQQMSPEQAQEAINQIAQQVQGAQQQGQEMMQDGGNPYIRKYQDGSKGQQAVEEFSKFFGDLTNNKYGYGDLPAMRERFKYFNNVYGLGITEEQINKADLPTLNKFAGQMQSKVSEKYPEVAIDYGANTQITRSGLQWAADNGVIDPKQFPSVFTNGKANIGLASSKVSDDDRNVITQILSEKLPNDKRNDFSKANFSDNEWYYRAPEVREIEFNTQAELDAWKEANKLNQLEGTNTFKANTQGAYIVPFVKGQTPEPNRERPNREVRERDRAVPEKPFTPDPYTNEAQTGLSRIPLQPYQPDLISGVRIPPKFALDYQEISPVKVSPEQTLRENFKNSAVLENAISQNIGMTGTQAAAIADVNNRAIMQSQDWNAKDVARVDAANAGMRTNIDNQNINFADTFQSRALLGEENTLAQINQNRRESRDWTRTMNKDQRGFAAIQAMNPNYQFVYDPISGGYNVNYIDRGKGTDFLPQNIVQLAAEQNAVKQDGGTKKKINFKKKTK